MYLHVTPITNVKDKTVVDNSLVTKKDYDWNDIVAVFNVATEEAEKMIVKNLSLFDHRLYIDDQQFYMLHALSK
jgi:hypothetical protein